MDYLEIRYRVCVDEHLNIMSTCSIMAKKIKRVSSHGANLSYTDDMFSTHRERTRNTVVKSCISLQNHMVGRVL